MSERAGEPVNYQVAWPGVDPQSQEAGASQGGSSHTFVAGTAVAGTDRLAAEVDCTGVAAWGVGWRGGTAVQREAVGGLGWWPRVEVAQHWTLHLATKDDAACRPLQMMSPFTGMKGIKLSRQHSR